MYVMVGILCMMILILVLILWKYQRQVKDICRQLSFLKDHESNMMISREIDAGGIGELSDLLNDLLDRQKKERRAYLDKEKVIADTYTNLSHDIRTPLTSLDGYFQLLEESTDPREQRRYQRIIHERINSLKEMLEELFTFTKLKNESYHLELSTCCINRILKDTVFSYYDDWMKHGIEPQIEIPGEQYYIEGNEAALKRIIQNIIKNGLDHGERKIHIRLSRESDTGKEQICLEISNQIPDAAKIDADKVFERFYKADEARSKNSTGLGLAIARELILRMNGEAQARVEGQEFSILIRFCAFTGGIMPTYGHDKLCDK